MNNESSNLDESVSTEPECSIAQTISGIPKTTELETLYSSKE
ncbi:unnamed protein product, partial [Brachionus calyciflorus]